MNTNSEIILTEYEYDGTPLYYGPHGVAWPNYAGEWWVLSTGRGALDVRDVPVAIRQGSCLPERVRDFMPLVDNLDAYDEDDAIRFVATGVTPGKLPKSRAGESARQLRKPEVDEAAANPLGAGRNGGGDG